MANPTKPTTGKQVPEIYLDGPGTTQASVGAAYNGYVTPASDPSVPDWKRNLLAGSDALPMLFGGLGQLGMGVLTAPTAVTPAGLWAIPAGNVTGGGIGGMAGQALREGAYRMLGYPDAPGTIDSSGKEQAAMSLVGEGLAPAAQWLAKQGYMNLFRPTVRMLREDPTLLHLAYKLNTTIPKEGSKSAARALQQASKAYADQLVEQASAGTPVEVGQVMFPSAAPAEAVADMRRAVGVDLGEDFGQGAVPQLTMGARGIPERSSADAIVPRPSGAMVPVGRGALVPAAAAASDATSTAGPRLGATFTVNTAPTVAWSELEKAERAALKAAGQGDTGERAAAIRQYFKEVRENWNPSGDPNMQLTYQQLMTIKRGADETSSPVYRAKLVASNQAKPDGYYKGAEQLRNTIMRLLDDGTENARVPGLRKVNSETQQYARVAALAEESSLPRKFNYFAPHHGTNPIASTVGLATTAGAHFLGAPMPVAVGAGHLGSMLSSSLAESQKPAISQALLMMAKNPNFRFGVSQVPRAADYAMGYPFFSAGAGMQAPMPQAGPFGNTTPGEVYFGGDNP